MSALKYIGKRRMRDDSFSRVTGLKYYQNSFSIDFSTFDYSMANDAKYIYKLIPYDKDWNL